MLKPIPKWTIWLAGALAWVAGVSIALFALAATARAELAFVPEHARLACPGVAPVTLAARGNTAIVPAASDAQLRGCRIEIDFAVRDAARGAALAERAAGQAYVELLGLGLTRAAFPARYPVNRDGIALAPRPGGLILSLAAETLFAGERRNGTLVILGWRSGDGADAQAFVSSTLLVERAGQRERRTGN